jgi:hypothetical protein
MTAKASIGRWAWSTPAVVAVVAAAFGSASLAGSAAAGAAAASILQWLAWRAYSRALGAAPEDATSVAAANERVLRALGSGAAIRLFGGVVVIVLAARVDAISIWPFVAGFGIGYAVLEVVVGRWLIANERRG